MKIEDTISKKLNKITYITYQVFPNEKANTIQTMRMLESMNMFIKDVKLIFPDRGKFNKKLDDIRKFYEIDESFDIEKFPHRLPFNRINLKRFEKYNFIISSFIWSFKTIKKYSRSISNQEIIMTRTHWVLYFASSNENKVIYECHKFSKVDNLVFKKLAKKNNVIIIFPNESLRKEFHLSNKILNKKFRS